LAWLAAAQIARNEGYPCSATLVEYSVKDIPYYEGPTASGPFTSKIRSTLKYQSYVDYIKFTRKTTDTWKPVFEKADNPDLFYSLHKVTVYVTGYYVDTAFASYHLLFEDVFDFSLDNNYMGDLFATIVNNWAWLCQQTHVLHPISVSILIIESGN